MPAPDAWSGDQLDQDFAREVTPDPERLASCIQCGTCSSVCPTAARMAIGPQRLVRLIQLGLREETLQSQAYWLCTSCDSCSAHCPRGIPFLKTMIGLKTYAIGHGLPRPEDLDLLRSTVASSYNISGDPNQERLGWSLNIPKPLKGIEGRTGADLAYFVGCVSSLYPRAFSIPQAFGRTLESAGLRFTTLGAAERCCGYPLYHAGLSGDVASLAEHNLRRLKELRVKRLVTTCPSCHYTWKVLYPSLGYTAEGIEVVHATQFLAELIESGRIKPAASPRIVTYHDPCDLGRKSGEMDAPRRILERLPGVELREMANIRMDALCCGGGGDVKIFSHDATIEVARRRIQQAIDVEADTLVTACQQCKRALVGAVQWMRHPIRVLDVTELVWESVAQRAG